MARLLMQTRKGVKEYTLGVNPITVGRLPANTLSFKSDEKMSRTHFIIKPSTEGYSITDLNSANGTFVNGERITERILKEGDKIQAGQTIFIFKEK
ncbi:MAG: FHA domain-containing protein [Planctomycetota bacterium]|nr:FHA domain-containing protein [Planctomycetota bacterium]